jgi:hypothetical protein
VYSVACITRLIPWERVSIGGHALAILALQPLVVTALWLTGGSDAYLGPILVLPMLYDRFGHTTGDRVLRELAAHATAAVRAGDCLARIGGDEFALVAPGAGRESADRLAACTRSRTRAGSPFLDRPRLAVARDVEAAVVREHDDAVVQCA